jgi:hypothetical protein
VGGGDLEGDAGGAGAGGRGVLVRDVRRLPSGFDLHTHRGDTAAAGGECKGKSSGRDKQRTSTRTKGLLLGRGIERQARTRAIIWNRKRGG